MKNGHLVKRLVVTTLALGLLGANIKTMAEQAAESRRLSILSVKGENGFVIKGGTREIKAIAGMPLGQGSKVKTGADSNLFMEADDDKVMKLDSQSVAEITGVSSKKLKITLKSGSLFFQVDRKLAEDEELTFDAAQTSMSIRGTGGILSFKEKSLEFSLIEGSVDWTIGNETVAVDAGETVVLKEVADGLSLDKNGMNSIYELLEKKKLDWRELDDFGLETLLEQEGRMDLSAVGYNPTTDRQEAQELLERKREERRKEEDRREQLRQQQEERNGAGQQIQRQDGRPPEEQTENSGGMGIQEPVWTENDSSSGADSSGGADDSSGGEDSSDPGGDSGSPGGDPGSPGGDSSDSGVSDTPSSSGGDTGSAGTADTSSYNNFALFSTP